MAPNHILSVLLLYAVIVISLGFNYMFLLLVQEAMRVATQHTPTTNSSRLIPPTCTKRYVLHRTSYQSV